MSRAPLAQRLLSASEGDLAAIVARARAADLTDAMEALAGEVLRMMRTDTRRALEVADRAQATAQLAGTATLGARAAWMRGHALSGLLRMTEACDSYEAAARGYRSQDDRFRAAKVAIGHINALMYLGSYDRAVEIASAARAVFARQRLPLDAARIDINLGNLYHRLEQPREALRHYDRALQPIRASDDVATTRIIQFNRANVLTSLGRIDRAEELYREVQEGALADDETRTAGFAEYSLGFLDLLRGEYGRAHAHLEAARAVFEELDDAHYLTLALTDLAELFIEINVFARARSIGWRARALAERHGLAYETAKCGLLIGIACLGTNEPEFSAACLEDAEQTFEREGNQVWAAVCWLYRAELDVRGGHRAKASQRLEAATERFAAEKLPLREATARLRWASNEFERGDAAKAREVLDAARGPLRRVQSPWLRAQRDHLSGRLAMGDGRLNDAIRFHRKSVRRVEGLRSRIGIDEFRIGFSEDKAPIYADLVHALLERGGTRSVQEAFETVEQSRSRALVDLLAGRLHQSRGAADSRTSRLLTRLEKLRGDLNWLAGFDPDHGGKRRNERRLASSSRTRQAREEEIADIMHRLQVQDRELGALTAGETVSVDDVRRTLSGSTCVEYYVSDHGTTAFVLTEHDLRAVNLDLTREQITAYVSRLRFQIEKWGYGDDYVRKRGDALQRTLASELRTLGRLLWEPLGITGERVTVVPHGPLHSLPFHAFLDADGEPLLARHTFTWLPSSSANQYLGRPSPRPGRSQGARVLAVGVTDEGIPEVNEEVARVRRAFKQGRMLRGNRATRRRFMAEAEKADVVHIATHGAFREDDPYFSALRLSDGWMSLYDLYDMKLSADLVCLSACQSGRSWTGAGDELVGLARGFLHAGARSLVVSLWPVQDDSTAVLMEELYRRVGAGVPVEEALRQAMLKIREEWPHPYHWAPFVVMGRGGEIAPGRRNTV